MKRPLFTPCRHPPIQEAVFFRARRALSFRERARNTRYSSSRGGARDCSGSFPPRLRRTSVCGTFRRRALLQTRLYSSLFFIVNKYELAPSKVGSIISG